MAAVMIGVAPHKGSHTAVVIDQAERALDQVRVRACVAQAERLLAWAAAWPQRTWAVEGAGGLGCLLARQLVAAGERVLDVQPKLAARVRLLAAGDVNKNDPDDARPVAVAALRPAACLPVRADDHDQELIRTGFRMILAADPDIEVVAEVRTGIEAVLAAGELRPDVVLMDIRMPDLDGIEATRRILAKDGSQTQVVILTTFDLDEYVYDALHGQEQQRNRRPARRG